MIVIPELKTVVIVPPRSGSTALKAKLREIYEACYVPYRHGEFMQLQHLPGLFQHVVTENWKVCYVARHPMLRMKSLWRYMQEVSPTRNPRAPQAWIDRQNLDANRPFHDWLLNSTELFNDGAHPASGSPEAHYSTFFQVPATRKGAKYFLRGAQNINIIEFGKNIDYLKHLGVSFDDIPIDNQTRAREAEVTWGCHDFIYDHHHADLLLMGKQ